MSEAPKGFEQWALLVDRQAAGEPLTAAELDFCERFQSEHPECQAELAFYDELGDIDAQPDQASRVIVEAALKRMEAEEASRSLGQALGDLTGLRKRRMSTLALVSGIAAIAAMFTLYVNRGAKRADADLRTAQSLQLTRAELVYASGEVDVTGLAATVGHTQLQEGSVIETREGSACVLLDPEINVCLAPQSRLRLSQINRNARRLDLLAGKASTRLVTQPEGMSLSIIADGIASTAVGTAFSVERGAQGAGVVTTVLNGKVRVGGNSDTRIVTAHERSVVLGSQAKLSSVSRAEEAPSWALLGPTVLWHDPVSATLDVHAAPAAQRFVSAPAAQAWLDDQLIGVAPLSSLIPVGAHRLVVKISGRVVADRELHVTAGDTAVIAYDASAPVAEPTTDLAAKLDPTPVKLEARAAEHSAKLLDKNELEPALPPDESELTPANAAELLSAARKLMREGRFADAAGVYQSIMQKFPGSETAHTVLVSLGQLQLTQLKQPEQALGSLDTYLAHGGSLSEEARVAKIHALASLHRDAAEASAIDELLEKHPHSLDAPELRARLAVLRGIK